MELSLVSCGVVAHPPLGKKYWFGRFNLSNASGYQTEDDFSASISSCSSAASHINSSFMFWCLENSYVLRDNRQFYDPQGLFRPLLEVMDLLPCTIELITHQYALASFMDIFDYAIKVNDLTEVQDL